MCRRLDISVKHSVTVVVYKYHVIVPIIAGVACFEHFLTRYGHFKTSPSLAHAMQDTLFVYLCFQRCIGRYLSSCRKTLIFHSIPVMISQSSSCYSQL